MTATPLQQSAEEVLSFYNIGIIPRNNIDITSWDRCVARAPNESPLAYSWVLDSLSPGWEGLIINNYEGVMPLPVSGNKNMKLLQMPHEVLTLGIFSGSAKIRALFPAVLYHRALNKFRFISYNGSPADTSVIVSPEVTIKQTFELNLNHPYNRLKQNFSRSHRRNIRAFDESRLEISVNLHPEGFTGLMAEAGVKRPELYIPGDYLARFDTMIAAALNKGKGIAYSVKIADEMVAAAFFLIGEKRCIAYHVANTRGKQMNVSFGLIDYFIKTHAQKELTIDFAGSVIPNVATFNRRFGAVPKNYPSVTINRLPFLWRMAKKMRLKHHALRLLSKKQKHAIENDQGKAIFVSKTGL